MNKKIIGIFILMLLICTVLPVSSTLIDKKTYNSTIFSNTLYVGGSGPNNYTKIQYAIYNATEGDTVFVYDDSSPYYENLVINKSIILKGENKVTTVIDGNGTGDIIYVIAHDVTISEFTIQNSIWDGILITRSEEDPWVNETRDIIIYNNNIKNVCRGVFGINLQSSKIYNNKIIDISTGIELGYSSNNNVSGNYITNAESDGIQVMGYFSLNKLYDKIFNKIHPPSKNNIIYRNIIENSRWGMRIGSGCIKTKIYENNISNNHDIGLELYSSTDTEIIKNNFIQTHHYINYEHSFFTVINKLSQYNTNIWDENYWSGMSNQKPIPINGHFVLVINIPIWINSFLEFNILDLPLIRYDKNPAKEPYDI